MTNAKSESAAPPDVEEILEQIKIAPLKTDDEFMAVLKLIDSIKLHVDPTSTAVLQMQTAIRHYNLNKKADQDEMTVVDALLLSLKDPKLPSGN